MLKTKKIVFIFILLPNRFDEDDVNFFSSQVRILVVDFILSRTSFENPLKEYSDSPSTNFGIEKLIEEGAYKAAYPLHDVSIILIS